MTYPDDVVERVTRLWAAQHAVQFDLLGEEVRDRWRQQTAKLLDAADVGGLVEALRAVLRRDEINTCPHDETYRGGNIWEICHACGAKWADDEGGKPEWRDPPEWTVARAALAKWEAK